MATWLDTLIFGIRKVFTPGGVEVTTRDAIQFVGATVADDAVNKRTKVTISAAALSNANPAPIGTTAPGVSGDASRADHVHEHGNLGRANGTGPLHTTATAGEAGFMSNADKTKLDGIEAGAINALAGDGLTRSGSTLNVGAHADGSIAVAADTVQVGVLASDAQHGNRGNGALHAVATEADAGFMPSLHFAKVGALGRVLAGTTQTVGATTASVLELSIFENKTGIVYAWVSGNRSDVTEGAGYVRAAAFRNNAGTVTQIGVTAAVASFEDDALWDCTIDVSANVVRIRVTGNTGDTVNWACTAHVIEAT